MDFKAKFEELLDSLKEWLAEQEWFQQLKQKWDELDAPSQTGIKVGAMGGGILLSLILVFSFIIKVHSLKREVVEKQDLLTLIQNAGDELKRLKETNGAASAAAGTGGGGWTEYLEGQATSLGLEKQNLAISAAKPGPSTDQAKESLIDMTLKHATTRQIVRLALGLEMGARPVKVRGLTVDTGGSLSGYMDASLSLSAFSIQPPPK